MESENTNTVGGKAFSLFKLENSGFPVPPTAVLTTAAYNEYVGRTKLRDSITFELSRKDFGDMRWEEIWDASLRIRNLFLNTPIPAPLKEEIAQKLQTVFSNADGAFAVRSSSIAEDSASRSFAGLHESYMNVKGLDSIFKHFRLVWASLWSDKALLYRKELGLDVTKSAMAVVIQKFLPTRCAGVAFSINPQNTRESVIEAVYGLNQGLVDGTIEPDRWTISREKGELIQHYAPNRDCKLEALSHLSEEVKLVRKVKLNAEEQKNPPLTEDQVEHVYETARKLEEYYDAPQDMEWGYFQGKMYLLQARPITTLNKPRKENGIEVEYRSKPWYLSLHRSYDNLKELWNVISTKHVPEMISQGDGWQKSKSKNRLKTINNEELSQEIKKRKQIFDHWEKVYWDDFIPFAHGFRMFGQFYNDFVQPENPYEFMELIKSEKLESEKRNELLLELGETTKNNPNIAQKLKVGKMPEKDLHPEFQKLVEKLKTTFSSVELEELERSGGLYVLIYKFAQKKERTKGSATKGIKDPKGLEEEYLNALPPEIRELGNEVLQLGRNSYKMRDDDNIYLGRIEAGLQESKREALSRIFPNQKHLNTTVYSIAEIRKSLTNPEYKPTKKLQEGEANSGEDATRGKARERVRQIQGQPASSGMIKGKARIVRNSQDLAKFEENEVLICDAIEPTMTFVVPLCSGIVERRGGMLIHGAIIAREYGIPCVTGVPNATNIIKTGDTVSVDGYIGLVIIHKADKDEPAKPH